MISWTPGKVAKPVKPKRPKRKLKH
jgi:hypothetical protein